MAGAYSTDLRGWNGPGPANGRRSETVLDCGTGRRSAVPPPSMMARGRPCHLGCGGPESLTAAMAAASVARSILRGRPPIRLRAGAAARPGCCIYVGLTFLS